MSALCGPVVRSAARAFPGASRRPQGKVTGQPRHRAPRAMPPVWRCVSRQSHLAAFEKEASKCPLARVPKGRRMTSAAGKWPGSPRAERNIMPGPIGTQPRPTTLPRPRREGRARARGLVVRGEPYDRVGGALPAVGQQQRQGLPQPAAGRRAAALDGGGGRCRRRGRREGLSRRRSPWRPARGLPGREGGDLLGHGELAPPVPRPSFVRRVPGVHRSIGGGGRLPQAVRE